MTLPTPSVSPAPTVDADDLPAVPATITDAAAAIRSGELTSVALVDRCLARADAIDPIYGVYLERLDGPAREAAATADAELAAGTDRGPLHGIPMGIKDIIATRESSTTGQSLVHAPAWADEQGDAPVVARLRAAGAVIIGKTSTMEFAIGMPDPAKPFPVPRNPWNAERWTGGSSSGTGAGLAAGLFLGGLGTDTGGSVRIPAAFCGISGHKQTFGLVPKSGCIPLGFSLDHIGPMTRSAADCAAMLRVMAGPAVEDATSVAADLDWSVMTGDGLAGVRIGVDRANHLPVDGVVPEAVAAFEAAVAELAAGGAELVEIELPSVELMRAAGMVTSRAEASAYHRSDLADRWGDYGVHTAKAVAMGTLVSGADYVQAQRVRRTVNAELDRTFAEVDLVVTPTAGCGAPPVDGLDHTSFTNWPVFTQYWNPTGLPALAVPMGFADDGLPLSLQIAGPGFSDPLVLRAGAVYQGRTDWHLRLPPLA